MFKWLTKIIAIFLLFSVSAAAYSSGAILQITADPSGEITLQKNGNNGTLRYTVKNMATKRINNIVLQLPSFPQAQIAVANDQCSNQSLASNQSCAFTLVLRGSIITSGVTLIPTVCGFGGAICSRPVGANRVVVRVVDNGSTINSITIIPSATAIAEGTGRFFKAIATLSNGSTLDITNQVVWHSSNTGVATIDTSGKVTSQARGNTTVTATANGITAQASVAVTYAYVINQSNNTGGFLTFCSVAANGSLQNCGTTTGGGSFTISGLYGIALNPHGSNLYVTDFGVGAGNVGHAIYRCPLTNGTIGTCIQVNTSISNPDALVVNSAESILYVTDATNVVHRCPINANGDLGSCTNAVQDNNIAPAIGLALNPAGTIAYVTDFTNDVFYCKVGIDGNFSACTATGNGFSQPEGIAINATGTIAYITNRNLAQVSYCKINANGSLSVCQLTGNNLNDAEAIAIDGTNSFAYITNFSGDAASYCPINADGSFGNCQPVPESFDRPIGITVFR